MVAIFGYSFLSMFAQECALKTHFTSGSDIVQVYFLSSCENINHVIVDVASLNFIFTGSFIEFF